MAVHGFFTVVTLYAFIVLRQEKRLSLLAFFALTLFLAVQTREDANLLVVAAVAGFLMVRPAWGRWRDIRGWKWIVAGLGIAWLPHLAFLCVHTLPQIAGQLGDSNRLLEFVFQEPRRGNILNNLFIDPNVAFPFVPLMAVFGFWGLLRRDVRFGLWLAGTLAAMVALASLKTYTDVDRVLFHGQYQSVLALLVGGSASLFSLHIFKARKRLAVALAMLALASVLIQPLWARAWIGEERLLQSEYRLEGKAKQAVDEPCKVVAFTGKDLSDQVFPPVMAYLPTWALLDRRIVSLDEFLARKESEIDSEECILFYRSSACYTYSFDELGLSEAQTLVAAYDRTRDLYRDRVEAMERNTCREIFQRYEASPVVETTVERPDWDGGNIPRNELCWDITGLERRKSLEKPQYTKRRKGSDCQQCC